MRRWLDDSTRSEVGRGTQEPLHSFAKRQKGGRWACGVHNPALDGMVEKDVRRENTKGKERPASGAGSVRKELACPVQEHGGKFGLGVGDRAHCQREQSELSADFSGPRAARGPPGPAITSC